MHNIDTSVESRLHRFEKTRTNKQAGVIIQIDDYFKQRKSVKMVSLILTEQKGSSRMNMAKKYINKNFTIYRFYKRIFQKGVLDIIVS